MTKAEQEQVERVREIVDQLIGEALTKIGCEFGCIKAERNALDAKEWLADQILSVDGLLIKHPDQSLPEYDFKGVKTFFESGYNIAQQDMRMADFVRVIKEKVDEHNRE